MASSPWGMPGILATPRGFASGGIVTRFVVQSLGRMPAGQETERTVAVMIRLALAGALDARVLEWARTGVAPGRCAPAADRCRARALCRWIARTGRYVPDPRHAELLTHPGELAAQWGRWGYFVGDCDDFAILAAAGALAVGLHVRYVVLDWPGVLPGGHVFAEVWDGGRWQACDPAFPGAANGHRGRRREWSVG